MLDSPVLFHELTGELDHDVSDLWAAEPWDPLEDSQRPRLGASRWGQSACVCIARCVTACTWGEARAGPLVIEMRLPCLAEYARLRAAAEAAQHAL